MGGEKGKEGKGVHTKPTSEFFIVPSQIAVDDEEFCRAVFVVDFGGVEVWDWKKGLEFKSEDWGKRRISGMGGEGGRLTGVVGVCIEA